MAQILAPFIPESITVHLGPPDAAAENVTLAFPDYIKNVASSEIYPTWPESALRANIYAIISFALNRVYTEWYRSRDYDFDVASLPQYDQAFVKDRDIFENISQLVDSMFNSYVVRQGSVAPLFATFCNGTTSTCAGLSQWGSVDLAEQGYSAFEILQYYYGPELEIVENAPVAPFMGSYPGKALRLGDVGNDVWLIQVWLNRIGRNYPALTPVLPEDGVFRVSTQAAVRTFQDIAYMPVTGVVDQATWYRLKRYYAAVRRLGEVNSPGVPLEEATLLFPEALVRGDEGREVQAVQYYLNVIAGFDPGLVHPSYDGVFGEETEQAVREFQAMYGLPVTGVVDRATWYDLLRVYNGILEGLPEGFYGERAKIYPGYVLSEGVVGEDVRDLQAYLNRFSEKLEGFPGVAVDGIFGPQTRDAVYTFQAAYGLPVNGLVGPVVWNEIARVYDSLMEE